MVKDVALMHEIATQLRIYGITFAIDDFGEGFSSFARLRELPFARTEARPQLRQGQRHGPQECRHLPDDHRAGAQFGALAVAEGLENAADLQAVHRMGCDIGQGYFLARPMPKAKFLALLRSARCDKRCVMSSLSPVAGNSSIAQASA